MPAEIRGKERVTLIAAIIINPDDKKMFVFGGQETLENFCVLAKKALTSPDHDVIYVTNFPGIDMVYDYVNKKDLAEERKGINNDSSK